ncbi:MAG: acylphosphatase [Anaerolineae bacterium]
MSNLSPTRIAELKRLHVTDSVQGVGFRPLVFNLAQRLNLGGFVGNDMTLYRRMLADWHLVRR